ncbi:YhdP family protein [Nitrosomonas sp. Is37]|uniref:YhdP family protein n=1 Tax=Nitrosomonas sp. Is37 TaxID=3080535 RepID=UPI00294B4605|nr:YhdP family protein [Nitrosomonas sp. Is37]MDV6344440.1 YhdP family protein [Nitrosomonas sp. Is37]
MMHSFIKHSILTLRRLGWAVFAVTMFFFLLLLSLRYWLLPDIERYRPNIAAAISQVAGQVISIERIDANWDGLHPYLRLYGVRVHDKQGIPVLILTELDGSLSWRSLLYGELLFREIRIERPVLNIHRDAEGVIHIAGGTFDQEDADNGFFDWLLSQRQLLINDADVYWLDEPRAAPVLYLKKVGLRMHNKDGQHRFGLRLTPPDKVAAPIDIRGDFTGESVNALDQWRGRLFAQLNHVDLGALQTWLSFPGELEFDRGSGAFRAWIGMEGKSVTSWIADVNLHEAYMHWAKDLPRLDLTHLRGRVGWKRNSDADQREDEWFAQQLSVAIENELLVKPVNILWQRWELDGEISEENKLRIDDLDLSVVASLISYLPIENSLQKHFSELSPKGAIEHAQIYWQGDWTRPLSFTMEGSFHNLAMKEFGKLPPVSGISGSVKVSEQGGSLSLDSDRASMKLFEALDEPLELDRLIAQVDWKISPDQDKTLFKFNHIAFANRYVSGTMHGRYHSGASEQLGTIDLAGELTNAEVSYVKRYLAVVADREAAQNWLDKVIVGGRLEEVKFAIQGDLSKSSSELRDKLALKLITKITDTTVNLPEGWPSVTDIQADLSFQDNQLEMAISRARMADIVVKDTRLRIADLDAPQPILQLKGGAEGATQNIINLIEKSPLNLHAADFSYQGNITGNGKLRLELAMPIKLYRDKSKHIELMGHYQFIDNKIDLGHDLPALSKVNGLLAFTESTLTIEDVRAQMMGGPVKINSIALPNEGMRIVAAGKANFDHLHSPKPDHSASTLQLWLQFMQGVTDWSAVFDISEKGIDVKVESPLVGAASSLPEPFAKTAGEMIPFSFEKKSIDSEHEILRFRYGEVVTAEIQRVRGENGHYYPARGAMNFRAAPAELPKDTVTFVHGTIPVLEWDRWKALFDRHDEITARSGQAGRGIKALLTDRVNFNLNIGRLDFLGSRFNEFVLNANKHGGQWHTSVVSKEVIGDIVWDSVRKEAFARLKKMVKPETIPESDSVVKKKNQPKDWPIMDLHADEFYVGERLLGKLVLLAHQQIDGWHIDQLQITHADSSLLMQGVWQNRITPFQMQAEVELRAKSIGKFLARLGYPGRIARGKGEVAGSLVWMGEPFSIDFPSLSGNLRVAAQRGQFTRFKPGVSKLLGIFDLKSLPRRLTLDFYDVFSQGFGFDDILGDVRITRGVAVTDELQIAGSAAYLAVSGEIDLTEETQALLVKTFPSLGLATPVVGIASMIANQSLKDPFDRVLFNEYVITGTWDKPVVVKSQNSQEIKESQQEFKRNEN